MHELRHLLTEQILAISGVTQKIWAERADGFSSFVFKNTDFAHFHHDHELDLRLSKKLIAQEALTHPKNSLSHPNRTPNSAWIELSFHSKKDVSDIIRLVKLAITTI